MTGKRARLRDVSWTRSAMWGDAEVLCVIASEALDDLSFAVRRFGGRCHRNAVEARRRRTGGEDHTA